MTGHKKYIQFSGNMVKSPLVNRARTRASVTILNPACLKCGSVAY